MATTTSNEPTASASLDAPIIPINRQESSDALDKLLQAETGEPSPDETKPESEPKLDGTTSKPAGDDSSRAVPVVADSPGLAKPVSGAGDDKSGAGDSSLPPAEEVKKDVFDAITVPPHTKEKTAESFNTLKKLAREQVAAAEAKAAEEIKKHVEAAKAAEEKLAAIAKETEDLRQWKQSLDVESDPTFKEFDKKQTKNVENIVAKLTEAGFDPQAVQDIKKHNAKIVWDDVWTHFEKNPAEAAKLKIPLTTLRRYVEARLLDNENIADQKKESLAEAKKNAAAFLEKRSKDTETQTKQAAETIKNKVVKTLSQFPWSSVTKIPDTATAEQKAQLEAQNTFAQETQKRVNDMLANQTPEDVADYIAGSALAYFYLAQSNWREKQLKDTEAKLATATEELNRIKKASGATRGPSNAPQKQVVSAPKIGERAEDALDRLRDEELAAQRA